MTGLRPHVHEKDLAELFTKFGDITNIIHKGVYAFIEYVSAKCAEDAVKEMESNQDSDLTV